MTDYANAPTCGLRHLDDQEEPLDNFEWAVRYIHDLHDGNTRSEESIMYGAGLILAEGHVGAYEFANLARHAFYGHGFGARTILLGMKMGMTCHPNFYGQTIDVVISCVNEALSNTDAPTMNRYA